MNKTLLLAAALLSITALQSKSQTIAVELVTPGSDTPLADTTVAGAADGATSGFDNVDITGNGARASGGVTLTDNSGTATTANLLLTGPQQGNGDLNAAPATSIATLYNNFIQNPNSGFNTDGTAQNATAFNLTNIPYLTYNILVYVQTNSGSTAAVSLGGTTPLSFYLTDSTGPGNNGFGAYIDNPPSSYVRATGLTSATATVGANYVEFMGLTGASQTILVGSGGNASITSAFEIVNAAGVAVPEPSTYALLAAGAALMFFFGRIRRAQR